MQIGNFVVTNDEPDKTIIKEIRELILKDFKKRKFKNLTNIQEIVKRGCYDETGLWNENAWTVAIKCDAEKENE